MKSFLTVSIFNNESYERETLIERQYTEGWANADELRYLRIFPIIERNTSDAIITGSIDDIEFYNNKRWVIKNFNEEELEMSLIDGGLEDFDIEDQSYFFTTSFENFGLMQKKLEELDLTPKISKLERIPIETKNINSETVKVILKMIEKFEEDEDVQEVFHTLKISEN